MNKKTYPKELFDRISKECCGGYLKVGIDKEDKDFIFIISFPGIETQVCLSIPQEIVNEKWYESLGKPTLQAVYDNVKRVEIKHVN